jgi:predicted ATPase
MSEPTAPPVLCLLGPPRWGRGAGDALLRVDRSSQLLCILAARAQWVARDELAEWLWPERSQQQSLTNLRTALLRAGRQARGVPIEREGSYLRWLPATDLQLLHVAAARAPAAAAAELPAGELLQGMEPGLGPAALEWLEGERQRIERLRRATARQRGGPADAAAIARPLIGRRHERAQLRALLADTAVRLVTVIGPGGSGKSALVREATAGHAEWVALEPCTDEAQVPVAIADALGRSLSAGLDPWLALELMVDRAPLALVLDGVEHLPQLPLRLRAWLGACPGLRLVATTRRRLGLDGEQLLQLDGLPLPDEDERDAEVLQHNDAVRLFCTRARAQTPGFALAGHSAAVVRLMHALGGLPLAIELAASWVRLLTLDDIVRRFERPAGAPMAAAAADALRDSLDRSWQLLSLENRHALAHLALLPLPVDEDIALHAAHAGLPKLAALVDDSMLQAAPGGGFTMHQLTRQHAAASAEAQMVDRDALELRHLARVDSRLGPFADFNLRDPRAALDELQALLPQVRAAWATALKQGDAAFAGRHAPTLAAYFGYRGGPQQESGLIAQAAVHFGSQAPAGLLLAAFQMVFRAAQLKAAETLARQALRRARLERNTRAVARALNGLALAIGGRGETDGVHMLITQGLRIARQHGHRHETGLLLSTLARHEKAEGRYTEAEAHFLESLAIAREGPDPNHEGIALQTSNLANLHAAQGAWLRALPLFEQARAHARDHGIDIHVALIESNLARACLALDRPQAALQHVTQACRLAREQGRALLELHALHIEARLHARAGDLAAAREVVLRSLSIASLLALPAELARGVAEAARIEACAGDVAGARARMTWALARTSLPADARSEMTHALESLDTAAAVNKVADAAPAFDAAVRAAMQDVERAEGARTDPRPR